MLAVLVTVQMQLLVPEFTATHLPPYLLTIPLCGQWNVQWSEAEYWLCFSVGYFLAVLLVTVGGPLMSCTPLSKAVKRAWVEQMTRLPYLLWYTSSFILRIH